MDNCNGGGEGSSALIFLGTGCSSGVPRSLCLIQPSDPPCSVCYQSLSISPERNPNYRCNSSLLIDYCQDNGDHNYILIDVGKTFREQVLRWFTLHQIPRVDSVSTYHGELISFTGEKRHGGMITKTLCFNGVVLSPEKTQKYHILFYAEQLELHKRSIS